MDSYSQSAVIKVLGVGGGGGNAVSHMVQAGLEGVDFICINTDAQALKHSKVRTALQIGCNITKGLGAGADPEVGRQAAMEDRDRIIELIEGCDMLFITAGMGGGTGTGAAPVIARVARELGVLTVGVVTKPFQFEGMRRMRIAEGGIVELQKCVDTLIVIPNQNLFRVANEKTTFADAFAMADQVLYSGVACITDLMVKEGLINLDFADVRAIMGEMGKAMMGTGEASGEHRAVMAAEAAIANPLLDETSMRGARGLLISITGGNDLTLYEVDEAASRIRQEVDEEANIILGATFDAALDGVVRVSVVATGIDQAAIDQIEPVSPPAEKLAEIAVRPHAATPRGLPTPIPAESPAEPAPAPAVLPLGPEEIEIRAAAPRPAVYVEPAVPRDEEEEAPVDEEFIPPAPELPGSRQPRMPQIEDLPPLAQRELRAHRGDAPAEVHPAETRRRSLLEKLAAFGINRREEEAPPAAPRVAPPALAPARPASAPSVHAEYGRPQPRPAPSRPAQGGLDPHGRAAQRPAPIEEEQLEIPAFLRRQSN